MQGFLGSVKETQESKQEATATLVYFMTFLGRKSVDG